MKITSYAVARPANYDRNASSILQVTDSEFTPHGQTNRGTYTVAAGKKLYLESASIFLLTTLAPTVAGRCIATIYILSGTTPCYVARLDGYASATLYATRNSGLVGQPTVYAGEQLLALTLDDSTGGRIGYNLNAKMTLFDS